MPKEVVQSVKRLAEKEIPHVPLLNVGWFGGEPCLALDVIGDLSEHFLALCTKHGVKYRSSITTNGYFLSEKNVTRLLDWGIGHFQITVDGSEEAHDTVRKLRGGQATYRRIFNHLIGMSKRKDSFSVAVRVNLHAKNAQHTTHQEAHCRYDGGKHSDHQRDRARHGGRCCFRISDGVGFG